MAAFFWRVYTPIILFQCDGGTPLCVQDQNTNWQPNMSLQDMLEVKMKTHSIKHIKLNLTVFEK